MQEAANTGFEAFDLLGIGVLVCAPGDLTVRFANARAKALFGPDLPGRPLLSAIATLELKAVAEASGKGRPYTLAGEIAPPSGRRIAFRLTISPRRLGPEELLVAEIEDVTKQREQEHLLDSFSRMVERKTREIEKERERAEKLLMNVFPYSVLQEFKEFGTTTPSFYDEVSVMFLDFVGFTRMPVSKQPKQLIAEFNEIFSTFDQITEHHSCERIKTIGDAYLAVTNMPSPNPDHALDITRAAIKILRYLRRRNQTHPIEWTCRIGIHTGSVVGSVVGIRKYIYDVFGDGVNTASRMQSLSEPMQITVSEQTYRLIRTEIPCVPKGEVELKGAEKAAIYQVDASEAEAEGGDPATAGEGLGRALRAIHKTAQ
jgi:class 3 adenylate cyclase